MGPEEMVVAIVASIGGIALIGFVVAKITGLVKAWINRNKTGIDEEEFDRLAQAFIEYKKNTQRRLENLEAITSKEDEINMPDKKEESNRIESPEGSIEIEELKNEEEQTNSGDSNLKNMLRE